MSKILFFDTETTGIPDWKIPSDDPTQPHIVQLAALLCDSESQEVLESMDVIVAPNGWVIPDETIELHGITNERAAEEGIDEKDALYMFLSLYEQCDLRVAHNTTFDNRIIRIALKRYLPDVISDEEWKDKDRYYCTLMNARKIMGGNSGHKLEEVYKHFIGERLVGAHSAMNDTRACREIYFAMTAPKATAVNE